MAVALGAGGQVPVVDALAAAVKAQSPHLAPERRRHIANDAADREMLDGLAVGAADGGNLLAEQAAAFVVLGFVAALFTAVFLFPSHWRLVLGALWLFRPQVVVK